MYCCILNNIVLLRRNGTKVGVDEMGVDEVGVDEIGVDEMGENTPTTYDAYQLAKYPKVYKPSIQT